MPTAARRSVNIAVLSVLLLLRRRQELLLLLLSLLLLLMVRQFYVAAAEGSGAVHCQSVAADAAAIVAAADATKCGRFVAHFRMSELFVSAAA